VTENSKTGLWALVGKIATILTVIGGLIGIWTWYESPGTKLQATVEYGSYQVDPNISSAVEKLRKVAVDISHPSSLSKNPSQDFQKLTEAANLALQAFSEAKYFGTSVTGGYLKTEITNTGDLSVKEVALRVPHAYVSVVTFDDKSEKVLRNTATIELGEIKPKQIVSVYSWIPISLSTFGTSDDLSLTHSTGKGSISVKGERSMACKFLTDPIGLGTLISLIIIFFTNVYQSGKKEGMKDISAKPSTNADTGDTN